MQNYNTPDIMLHSMLRKIYKIVSISLMLITTSMSAQTNIRYVSKSGSYTNSGTSWAQAKNNVQDAINDLVNNGLTGEVWVAAGTYTPTESTESNGGSTLYMSFKIPTGITVRGGFAGTEDKASARATTNYFSFGWFYTNQTILSGNLSSEPTFVWNETTQRYKTTWYGNCYHVVWFATEGFDEDGRAKSNGGAYNSACLEGCVIEHGYANNSDINSNDHNGNGGGVYMVQGSKIESCWIRNCAASRNGGGIYMDGGGFAEHVYVTDCQTLGVGTSSGYGGGVCMNGPTADEDNGFPVVLRRSGIINCVGRLGGGIGMITNNIGSTNGTQRYRLACSAVLVANNTATTEGGGIYTEGGAALTQMTVVNNRCNGAGTTSNGLITGRSAGIYTRDNLMMGNSVLWGGSVEANNDIQFAATRSSSSTDLRPEIRYSTLNRSDYVDWSGVVKSHVTKLSNYNTAADEAAANSTPIEGQGYPIFNNPSPVSGHIDNGAILTLTDYDWTVKSNSTLSHAGILSVDLDLEGLTPAADVVYDIQGYQFNPRPTIGAYTYTLTTITPQIDNDNVNYYVDPDEYEGSDYTEVGFSWDRPTRFFSDVMTHIVNNASTYSGKSVNVYVKEGTINNTNSTSTDRVRLCSIEIPSNVNIYGGYPDELTGTDLETTDLKRNPVLTPTIITGDVIENNYDVNVAHLIKFDACTNVCFDGFQVRYANAASTLLSNTDVNGGGLLFLNGANVTVKNVLVAGCTAAQGAAVYATGASMITFENCIFHNNATYPVSEENGIISSDGTSTLNFNHCDVLRNVGYASYLGGTSIQIWTNSIFYGNMNTELDDTNEDMGGGLTHALPAFAGNTSNVSGQYCMFDANSEEFKINFGDGDKDENTYPCGKWQYNLQYLFIDGTGQGYPRFVNPTKNSGVSAIGDATYYGRSTSFMPHNNNPIVNKASTNDTHDHWGTDMSTVTTRDYGGIPDIGAIENHQAQRADEGENAYIEGQREYGEVIYVRDYNTYDSNGNVTTSDVSTTHEDGYTLRDGTSWANAINGNAEYDNTSSVTRVVPVFVKASTNISSPEYQYKIHLGSASSYSRYYVNDNSNGNLRPVRNSGTNFAFFKADEAPHNLNNTYYYAYYIYDISAKKYVGSYSSRNSISSEGNNKFAANASTTDNAVKFLLVGTYSNFDIIPYEYTTSLGWNFYGGVSSYGNSVGLYSTSDNNSSWAIVSGNSNTPSPTNSTEEYNGVSITSKINGLQYAINRQNEAFLNDGGTQESIRDVLVGAGVYSNKNITWYEGVNVKGGFPNSGNPGENERDISNTNNNTKTIIDANSSGRVLTQSSTFNVKSTFEGFTLRNGNTTGSEYGAGAYLDANGQLKNCLVHNNTYTTTSSLSTSNKHGGGGIYISTGGLVNCCIIKNNTANNSTSGLYVGGAGVFANGGTLQNSLIVENTTNSNYYLLGAGFFITSYSELYNCTIAYNFGNQSGNTTYPATGGVWDNVATYNSTTQKYSGQSSFYNCIIWGNNANGTTAENFVQVGMSGFSNGAGSTNDAFFTCYSSAVHKNYASDNVEDENLVKVTNTGYTARYANNNSSMTSSQRSNMETDNANFMQACYDYEPFYRDSNGETDYSLKSSATQCINMGSYEDVVESLGITKDIMGDDRVQDCTIDKGAYEYNDSYAISPDITSVNGQAIFYVTPNGYGTASANSPENAACAAKLQKVLDAAGRYKYVNPTTQVIVKVANSYAMQQAHNANETSPYFTYYANRTTDLTDQDVRVWSIIIPRGIEVWGGYTDVEPTSKTMTAWTNAQNGFYTFTDTDADGIVDAEEKNSYADGRDITGNPTYFDAAYYNKSEKNDAYTYHVLTFSNRVFDGNGYPYMATDVVGNASSYFTNFDASRDIDESMLLQMSHVTLERAIVDGLFITGGNANIAVTNTTTTTKNINQYGGAAIVNGYAHIRNCIIKNNQAIYGGALAMTQNGMVSGCLLLNNSATFGGGIYIFTDGQKLSNGIDINTEQGSKSTLDANMPHVYTSTIANNEASQQGGGIWFGAEHANVRVNSTVVWQNTAPDQANVAGLISPSMADDENIATAHFYPFAYSAVENQRMSGTNNIEINSDNKKGVRFALESAFDPSVYNVKTIASSTSDYVYYGLTKYSVLLQSGMPKSEYEALVTDSALYENDFMTIARDTGTTRVFIDIGARSLEKNNAIDENFILTRLYVADPSNIDFNIYEAMENLDTGSMDATEYQQKAIYTLEGSSFAFPFQKLDYAIEYIQNVRKKSNLQGLTNNIPFQIFISKGTYYPGRDLQGNYGYSLSNTFAIPEGVSIFGSFDATDTDKLYGQYYKAKYIDGNASTWEKYVSNDLSENIERISSTTELDINGYKILQYDLNDMLNAREHADINANNIIEPWEWKNQTVLSGNAINADLEGVYHVVTIVADENVNGALPKAEETYSDYSSHEEGSYPHESGQDVTLNGLQITGSYATSYKKGVLDTYGDYNYYHGGGLLVDGNRYGNDFNLNTTNGTTYKHMMANNAVAYRDIHVNIENCKFTNNFAGCGGAISSNCTLEVFNSSFEQNTAENGHATVDVNDVTYDISFPGQGGAIYSTYKLLMFNSLLVNNEALDDAYDAEPHSYTALRNLSASSMPVPSGCGGAIFIGIHGKFHIMNCNIVRNQANMYPALFTMNPNKDYTQQGNPEFNTSTILEFADYSQLINTVIWGNEINSTMNTKYSSNNAFQFYSRLICNYGYGNRNGEYTYSTSTQPSNQDMLDSGQDISAVDNTEYGETAWFCAYENGRGITPVNDVDCRDIDFTPVFYVRDQIYHYTNYSNDDENTRGQFSILNGSYTGDDGSYQNCNIMISSENNGLDGPNFKNPSSNAGCAGYEESSDWSPSRINNLTDYGSGKLFQVITDNQCSFPTYAEAGLEVPSERVSGTYAYSSETENDYVNWGAYAFAHYFSHHALHRDVIEIGETKYMTLVSTNQVMHRISFDPNPTHNMSYIDIGVYEYVHTELDPTIEGDECDILWVSNEEKPENGIADGSSWATPTSDLQRAIETLLASRNGHRKEIRLIEGIYTPIYTIKGNLSFYFDTEYMNSTVTLPTYSSNMDIDDLCVKSFTIKGGYSKDSEGVYDINEYPCIIQGQTRTNASSSQWNHLFYIYDAIQRYGNIATENNAYGAMANLTTGSTAEVKTIPIEINGVTFINPNALAGTNGAALCYEDQTVNYTGETWAQKTYVPETPTTANISCMEDGKKLKVYYTDNTYTTTTTIETDYVRYEYVENTSPAKLILANCKVMRSGTHNEYQTSSTSSAIYIGKNGGNALLYNNILHSNYGDPICSACNTEAINNTFALNAGLVNFTGTDENSNKNLYSYMFNNVFWKNNPTSSGYANQFSLPRYVNVSSSGTIFANNAFTGGNTEETDYTQGLTISTNNWNVGLSDDNSDVIHGPNFNNPKEDAVNDAEIDERDFNIQPSLRLYNKGNNKYYDMYNNEASSTNYNIYSYAWETIIDYDAAYNKRIKFDNIDLGAFEYKTALNRVLYVNPNILTNENNGRTWENSFGDGEIQKAIDLAAIYHVNSPAEETFVLVKGNSTINTNHYNNQVITLRDGVCVVGSINPALAESCPAAYDLGNDEYVYETVTVMNYIMDIMNARNGIASTSGNKTIVAGLKTDDFTLFNNNNSTYSLADGFVVTSATETTEPLININPQTNNGDESTVILSNIIVADNKVTNANIANIKNALVYEGLFHNNTVSDGQYVLNIDDGAYAVNLTVEGDMIETTAGTITHPTSTGDIDDGNFTTTGNNKRTFYSLVNFEEEPWIKNTLSGYCYALSDNNLNYQLTEKSKNIDVYSLNYDDTEKRYSTPIDGIAPERFTKFITYSRDRDLLGNPRLLLNASAENKIDRGAFETWKIDKPVVQTTEENFYYPHDNSVVYVMENNTLVNGHNLTPSYVLLKDGASLYGEGYNINASYIAIERQVNSNGTFVSMPFNMDYNTNATIPSYDNDGIITLTNDESETFTYDGLSRSAWNYAFKDNASSLWGEAIADKVTIEANHGVFFKPETSADTIYRFTGKGTTMADYVYTEVSGEVYKTVTLNQYDDRTPNDGGTFTNKENMGWNCIGLPYLISGYKTYLANDGNPLTDGYTGLYMMQIPHTMWLYYDGVTYSDNSTKANGDGGFFSVSSWTDSDWHLPDGQTASIWVGEGIFTQTSVTNAEGKEDIRFYLPIYGKTGVTSNAKERKNTRFYIKPGSPDEECTTDKESGIKITVKNHVAHITGLQGGEQITVYNVAGHVMYQKPAIGPQDSIHIPASGIYVIEVSGVTKKCHFL